MPTEQGAFQAWVYLLRGPANLTLRDTGYAAVLSGRVSQIQTLRESGAVEGIGLTLIPRGLR